MISIRIMERLSSSDFNKGFSCDISDTWSQSVKKRLNQLVFYISHLGSWSEWSPFSTCTQSCGGGVRTKTRTCEGGSKCPGSNKLEEACNEQACPGKETVYFILPINLQARFQLIGTCRNRTELAPRFTDPCPVRALSVCAPSISFSSSISAPHYLIT